MGVKMDEKQLQKILAVLSDKISFLENEICLKNYENEYLKKENARLNELLTPTNKVDKN